MAPPVFEIEILLEMHFTAPALTLVAFLGGVKVSFRLFV